jgi:hypothetical protein
LTAFLAERLMFIKRIADRRTILMRNLFDVFVAAESESDQMAAFENIVIAEESFDEPMISFGNCDKDGSPTSGSLDGKFRDKELYGFAKPHPALQRDREIFRIRASNLWNGLNGTAEARVR